MWRPGPRSNIGERLKAVEPYLQGEEMFLANYGDGLSDVPLPAMIDTFRKSNAVASLLLVQPTASFDLVSVSDQGHGQRHSRADSDRYLDQRRLLRDAQRNFQSYASPARNWYGSPSSG